MEPNDKIPTPPDDLLRRRPDRMSTEQHQCLHHDYQTYEVRDVRVTRVIEARGGDWDMVTEYRVWICARCGCELPYAVQMNNRD